MPEYVLVNRRAGKFTPAEKSASRAAAATALARVGAKTIVADHDPSDALARRVVLFQADAAQVSAVAATLPPDAVIEPAVRRTLHRRKPPGFRRTAPMPAAAKGGSTYTVKVAGGGKPLAQIEVMFYVTDPGNQLRTAVVTTDDEGRAAVRIPPGFTVALVEPIPYARFWIMLSEAPPTGSTIDCVAIAKAASGGAGWWHAVTGIDAHDASRGSGIKVGVIDTGCGPHPNLQHVTPVGAFVDGKILAPSETADVAEHGTHTSGLVGARPGKGGDYAGMAPGCELFHARVFKGEGPDDGPTQADLINAIDTLSRQYGCDLINMSLGGGPPSQAEEDAIRDAAERGTLCICSAGNEDGPIDFPGAYPECAAVSAIGRLGEAPVGTFSASNRPQESDKFGTGNLFLAAFSCFGPTLACAAPGVGIVSTVPDRNGETDLYMEMDGTSMASPIACGVLATILSQDATYKALPRDASRTQKARLLLANHCESIGLPQRHEGRGLIHT